MAHGYCVANRLSGLASSAFYIGGASATQATYLNDGRMGRLCPALPWNAGGGIYYNDIYFTFGSAVSLSGVAFLNHNAYALSPTASFELGASASGDFNSDYTVLKAASTVSSAVTDRKDSLLQIPASSSYKYWLARVRTNTSTTFTLGELFALGSITSFTRTGAYGSGEGAEVISVSSQMQGGERRYYKFGGPFWERRYSFADWNATELEQLRALWVASSGPVTPLLWVDQVAQTSTAASAAEQRCLFGHIQDARFDWTQDDYGVFQPPGLVLRSRAREMGA